MERFRADRVARLIAWVLAALAVLFLVWPVWRATLPLEVWDNEGWIAYHTDHAFDPRALYPPPDGFVANNYPPLWYLATAALARVFGDALYVGRALSLIAVLALGALAGVVARQFGATRVAAVVGGIWFVATMARFFDFYVGMDDPQLFAQAVMCAGFAWFVARRRGGRAVEPAVLLMVIAGFFKHNLATFPAVALIWLAMHDRRLAWRAALFGAAAAALGLALCAWLYAPNFISDLLMPRGYHLERPLKALGRLQFVLPALALWAIWAWAERRTEAARFSILFVAATLIAYLVQKAGAGVDENAQFDLVFATAVGIGVAFDRLLGDPWRTGWPAARIALLVGAVLVVRLLASTRMEFAYVLMSADYRAEAARHSAIMRAEAARIAAMPGPVLCRNLLVCRMAGKPLVYDNFYVMQLIDTGRTTRFEINARLAAAGTRVVSNDPRSKASSLYRRW